MLWYGSIASVPSGWHICDGTLNTPDLRNRFVIGAGSSYAVNQTGGTMAHGHHYDGPLHTHTADVGPTVLAGTGFTKTSDQSKIVGDTDWETHVPEFKALVYIMKFN